MKGMIVVDRDCNIIVNSGGIAHRTGWLYVAPLGGEPYFAKGCGYHKSGRHIVAEAEPRIPAPKMPVSVEDFKRITGWTKP